MYTDHASEYRLNIDINPQNEVSLGIRLCHKDEGRLCTSHLHNEHYRVDVCIKIPRWTITSLTASTPFLFTKLSPTSINGCMALSPGSWKKETRHQKSILYISGDNVSSVRANFVPLQMALVRLFDSRHQYLLPRNSLDIKCLTTYFIFCLHSLRATLIISLLQWH